MHVYDHNLTCFACNTSMTIIQAVMHFKGFTTESEAKKWLTEEYRPAPKPAAAKPAKKKNPVVRSLHFKGMSPSAKHPYYDKEGNLVFVVCRFVDGEGAKSHIPFTPNARGEDGKVSEWLMKRPDNPPLYNLREAAAAPMGVVLVEGEKCADALQKIFSEKNQWAAVSFAGGSSVAAKADLSPLLEKKHVILWPDNDTPGVNFMMEIRSRLMKEGHRKVLSVRMREEWPEKFDVADLIEKEDAKAVRAVLEEALKPPPAAPPPPQKSKAAGPAADPVRQAVSELAAKTGSIYYDQISEQTMAPGLGTHGSWEKVDADIQDLIMLPEYNGVGEQKRFDKPPLLTRIRHATLAVAAGRPRNPLREWLETLKWDGKPRVGKMASAYLGEVENPDLSNRFFYHWFLAAVLRMSATRPVKFDQMIVFEGQQGQGKARILESLFGDLYANFDVFGEGYKESILSLRGKICVEVAEMQGFAKKEMERVKSFIAASEDCYRPLYARDAVTRMRRFVMVGTTNERDGYLKDLTGNRRFWPIMILGGENCIQFRRAHSDRIQLFAEAFHICRKWLEQGERGEPPCALPSSFYPQAARVQQRRLYHAPLRDDISEQIQILSFDGIREISMKEIFDKLEIKAERRAEHKLFGQVTHAMMSLGWERYQKNIWDSRGGKKVRTKKMYFRRLLNYDADGSDEVAADSDKKE